MIFKFKLVGGCLSPPNSDVHHWGRDPLTIHIHTLPLLKSTMFFPPVGFKGRYYWTSFSPLLLVDLCGKREPWKPGFSHATSASFAESPHRFTEGAVNGTAVSDAGSASLMPAAVEEPAPENIRHSFTGQTSLRQTRCFSKWELRPSWLRGTTRKPTI